MNHDYHNYFFHHSKLPRYPRSLLGPIHLTSLEVSHPAVSARLCLRQGRCTIVGLQGVEQREDVAPKAGRLLR